MLLGIDIGGTTINLGLVKDNQIVTPEVTKIGIGVPTYVDSEKGIVYDAMNIPSWTVVPLKERLEKAFNKHTIIPAYNQHLSSRPRHRNPLYRHR